MGHHLGHLQFLVIAPVRMKPFLLMAWKMMKMKSHLASGNRVAVADSSKVTHSSVDDRDHNHCCYYCFLMRSTVTVAVVCVEYLPVHSFQSMTWRKTKEPRIHFHGFSYFRIYCRLIGQGHRSDHWYCHQAGHIRQTRMGSPGDSTGCPVLQILVRQESARGGQ